MSLTISEVAARLNLPVETVFRWVRQGKIPMQHSRGTYSIRPEILARWALEHKLEIQGQAHEAEIGDEDHDFDSILLAMQRGGVFYDIEGSDCETALKSTVRHIPNIEPSDCERVFEKLLEREHLASTGIGNGIALPHPRSNPDIVLEMPQITTCFLSGAIPFEAIDGKPVRVLMVLLSRSTKQHLAMLSKLSYYLRDTGFRNHLLTTPSKEELFEKISTLESKRD